MKVRYLRHSIGNFIGTSIKEGLDALLDDTFELWNFAAVSAQFKLHPPTINHGEPNIDGYRFDGWISDINDESKRIRLYTAR
jgi:hypothetical protein